MNGASGWRLLLSSIAAPEPLAHQWSGLMPLPMNSAANRLGKSGQSRRSPASPPQTGIDSSQGRAIVTPAPRSNVRRLIRSLVRSWLVPGRMCSDSTDSSSSMNDLIHSRGSSRPRLFRNCGLVTIALDQTAEAVAVGREPVAHRLDRRVVRRQQAASQGVGQQLAAEVVDELVAGAARRDSGAGRRGRSPRCRRGTSRGCRPGRPPRSRSRRSPIGP